MSSIPGTVNVAASGQPPRPTDLLLQGLATLPVESYAAAVPILKDALRAFRANPVLPPEESRWISAACRRLPLSDAVTRAAS